MQIDEEKPVSGRVKTKPCVKTVSRVKSGRFCVRLCQRTPQERGDLPDIRPCTLGRQERPIPKARRAKAGIPARRQGRSALGQRDSGPPRQRDGADHVRVGDTLFERLGRRVAPDYRPRRGILASRARHQSFTANRTRPGPTARPGRQGRRGCAECRSRSGRPPAPALWSSFGHTVGPGRGQPLPWPGRLSAMVGLGESCGFGRLARRFRALTCPPRPSRPARPRGLCSSF